MTQHSSDPHAQTPSSDPYRQEPPAPPRPAYPPEPPNPFAQQPTRSQQAALRIKSALLRGFHAYASWLISLSWKRFFVLALLFLILSNILEDLLASSWGGSSQDGAVIIINRGDSKREASPPASAPSASETPSVQRERRQIQIDEQGIRVLKNSARGTETTFSLDENGIRTTSPEQSTAASPKGEFIEPESESSEPSDDTDLSIDEKGIRITTREKLRKELPESEDETLASLTDKTDRKTPNELLSDLALLIVVASIIIKITYKDQKQAEAAAAAAHEAAETEALKRQVMEARLAAMQAQVEPHFLFNTLASIAHLIETDPPRAARMQGSLIHFLREAMPTLREANAQAERDLGRELAVVLPYLEILRMRMDERLHTEIQVPTGLHSAKFPPMMLQSLVENAIRHGLEPKAEGGVLRIQAEVADGRLCVSVSDNGAGFGKSQTAGTGVGLSNIRERLQLLYGPQSELRITEPAEGGTCVTICVPYQARQARQTT